MTKSELLNRCAKDSEQRIVLGRLLDKLETAQNRSVPAHTHFLSPAERAAAEALLAACGNPRHLFFGGFEGAERTACLFPPDWQRQEDLTEDEACPVAAVRVSFPPGMELSHRDVLGALTGLGLTREKIGDILVHDGGCDVLVLRDTLPILLSQWDGVGRARVGPVQVPLSALEIPAPKVRIIRDTVATLRLDAVVASGFSLSRGKAASLIESGRVLLNHTECDKPDKAVGQGDVLTCRGLGRCVVKTISGLSKKGRIMLELERYL